MSVVALGMWVPMIVFTMSMESGEIPGISWVVLNVLKQVDFGRKKPHRISRNPAPS